MDILIGFVILLLLGYSVAISRVAYAQYKQKQILEEWVLDLTNTTTEIVEGLEVIDNKGLFKSDDEVGWVFDSLKSLVYRLKMYRTEEDNDG